MKSQKPTRDERSWVIDMAEVAFNINYDAFHFDIHKTIAYRIINRFVQTKALSHVANIWPTKIMRNKLWWILFYFAYFEQWIIISSCVVQLFQSRISKAAWYGVKPATVRYFPVILVKRWSLHEKFTFIGCLADKFYCVKWWSIERTLRIDKNIYPREIQ